MHPLVNIATTAALEAGKIITRSLDKLKDIQVTEKQKNDFVSEVDIAAEQTIIAVIRKAHPDHAILAEESGSQKTDSDTTWIIDPLDGTRNFLHGFPHFAVSIAVQRNNRVEHGVIYDPIRQELFIASNGKGARMNDQRIRAGSRKTLDESLLATGFPFRDKDLFDNYMKTFKPLFLTASGIRRAGSAALDLAYVAAGRVDGFWEFKLQPWDMAAGALIIREAGGLVGDFSGSENFLKTGNIIAGNPKIFKAMLKIIQPVVA